MALVTGYSMSVGETRLIPYSAPGFDLPGGYTVRFRMKRSSTPGPPYDLDKLVTISNPTGTVGTIDMQTPDTLGFVPDVYNFDVTAINGTIQVPLTTGTFQLTERTSR